MDSQESVSIKSENKVQKELQTQKALKKARNSFQTQDITAMNVLKCTYVDKNTVSYKNKEYNISMCEDIHKYVNSGDPVYVPVIVLQHNSIYQTYTTGWYVDKNRANKKIRELEDYKDSFRYKLDTGELTVHKNKNKIFEKIYDSNILNAFANIDSFLLLTVPCCIYMLMYILLNGNDIIQVRSSIVY